MKIFQECFVGRRGSLRCGVFLIAFAGGVFQVEAQGPYTLSQNDSSVQVNLGGGVYDWQVDNVNQLNQQWFYYRVGSTGPEYSIDTIATPSSISSSPTRVSATYANSTISVKTSYLLSGQTSGSGKATLTETLVVKNASAISQDFHFYQYSDFDLGDAAGNQTVQFYDNGSGSYYEVIQSYGNESLTETVSAPAANAPLVQAGLYDATLLGLADDSPTTLDNTLSAGPGDVVYAYEWDATLGAGLSFTISKIMSITVPEPSVLTIMWAGAVALALLRRRCRAV
jgi:hypothetical protein